MTDTEHKHWHARHQNEVAELLRDAEVWIPLSARYAMACAVLAAYGGPPSEVTKLREATS